MHAIAQLVAQLQEAVLRAEQFTGNTASERGRIILPTSTYCILLAYQYIPAPSLKTPYI